MSLKSLLQGFLVSSVKKKLLSYIEMKCSHFFFPISIAPTKSIKINEGFGQLMFPQFSK